MIYPCGCEVEGEEIKPCSYHKDKPYLLYKLYNAALINMEIEDDICREEQAYQSKYAAAVSAMLGLFHDEDT